MKSALNKINYYLALPLIALISIYQRLLSPDHSWLAYKYPHGFCRFYPSCSEYAKQSLIKFGLFKGVYLSVIRIIKCNPLSKPKVDPLPYS